MDALNELKAAVFGKQKILAEIYRTFGQKSLFDYANSWPVATANSRTGILAGHTKKLLEKTYSKDLAEEVSRQLASEPLVSTIDHHGILNHPFFINSNLIFSLKNNGKYLICLTTSGVSLNNSSWPGCLLLNSPDGGLTRLSLFQDKVKTSSVFASPAFSRANVEKIIKAVKANGFLSANSKSSLNKLIDEVFKNTEVLNQGSFSSQASLVSTALWNKIFPSSPQVIYLPVEDLVSEIIISAIARDSGHILHRLFFSAEGAGLIEKYFSGSLGAFSSENKGSFLFWGVNKKGKRLHLHRQGLKIENGDLSFELKPEIVAKNLEQKQLYPTSLACFLVLLYYGVTCLGGFNQVNWLTEIKEKFLLLLKELGETESAGEITKIPTNNFAEGNVAFMYQKNSLIKATGMDLYLSGKDFYKKYQNLARELAVAESIDSLLPEIYKVITKADERQDKFLELSDSAIAGQNGMTDKIKRTL